MCLYAFNSIFFTSFPKVISFLPWLIIIHNCDVTYIIATNNFCVANPGTEKSFILEFLDKVGLRFNLLSIMCRYLLVNLPGLGR